jgi:hypothetical protein
MNTAMDAAMYTPMYSTMNTSMIAAMNAAVTVGWLIGLSSQVCTYGGVGLGVAEHLLEPRCIANCVRPVCVIVLCVPQAVQDDAARTAGFSLLLRRLFEECDEPGLLETAAVTLGHLVKHSGQSMSDIVERQVGGGEGRGGEGEGCV